MSIETAVILYQWVLIPAEIFILFPLVIYMVCVTIGDAVPDLRGRS